MSVPQKREGRKRRKVKIPNNPARESSLLQEILRNQERSANIIKATPRESQLWRKLMEKARIRAMGTCQGKPFSFFSDPGAIRASSPEESARRVFLMKLTLTSGYYPSNQVNQPSS
jgi:hypothetical protein